MLNPLPEGDILIHAGDFTSTGSKQQVKEFSDWFNSRPHKYKIVIAGNHDWWFQKKPEKAKKFFEKENVFYLKDSSVEIEGIKFYGSPWQPLFLNWAFNLERGSEIREKWELIPTDTDVLITHGPPMYHGDYVLNVRPWGTNRAHVGCEDLAKEIQDRVRPKLHIFGHIHEGYGVTNDKTTTYVNASICTRRYEPINPPIIIDLTKDRSIDIVSNASHRDD